MRLNLVRLHRVYVRRQITSALTLAKRTLELLRELLAMHRHEDPLILINHVREIGKGMIDARPQGIYLPLFLSPMP